MTLRIKIHGKRNLNLINAKYKYSPQMQEYDSLGQDYVLYSMFTQKNNFVGKHIRTDKFGFRLSKYLDKYISVESELYSTDKINIILGGSTVFGVGATNDDYTIASYMSDITKEKWINIGIRAANSFQEYITLIKLLNKIKNIGKIVIMSGINDIYLNLGVNNKNELDDCIFGKSEFDETMKNHNINKYSFKKKFVAKIISLYKGTELNNLIHLKSISDMCKFKEDDHDNSDEINNNNYFERISYIFDRNFLLYSALAKSLDETEIVFFLQPYFNWTEKVHHEKEYKILNYLEKKQKNTSFNILKKINLSLFIQ